MFKLLRFLKPYAWFIVGVLVAVFCQVMADLNLPTLMSDIVDKGVMNGNTAYILKTGGIMLLVAAIGVVCSILASYLSSRASMGMGQLIRNKIFEKVENFSLFEFDKIGTATLITRSTNDVTQVQMMVMMFLRMMLSAPMMAIGGLIMAFSEDRKLTLVLAVAIPILSITIILIGKKGMPLFKSIQKKLDRLNLVLRESLSGIRVIRAFNRTEHERGRFNEANEDLTKTYITVNRLMALLMPLMMFIMNMTSLAVLWFGIIRIDTGGMQMGSLIAFTQYAMQIMFSFLMVSIMFIMVPRASAAADRINEVLEVEPEIIDPAEPEAPTQAKGEVEFRDVTFRYHGAEQAAIEHISFSIKPGEFTAIIGSTGSGKSTLVKLIPRFYDADSGSILVDGVDIKRMRQVDLRAKIGYVPQKAVLFSGSIADNLRFGQKDKTDAELQKACEIAQATEFIDSMEDGLAHEIAQGGTNVSGGQKQRLSIARALARRPEIYIFDDSFSALDFKTDAQLRAALKREVKNATVLMVAQRVGTVMDADRIIVLDEGHIVGMGRHKELLETCPIYREIAISQLSEENIA